MEMDNFLNPLENPMKQADSLDALLRMNNHRVSRLLHLHTANLRGADGAWNFIFEDVEMMLFTDELGDRIRMIAHIDPLDEADQGFVRQILEANFITALDARYAAYQDTLWAVYTHPLASLTREQFVDAMKQVATLVKTTGSTFSSVDPAYYDGNDEA